MSTEPEKNLINKPKAEVSDAGHLAVRMALSVIPVIGGATKELFNTIIAPPLAKRQAEWMEAIAARLIELEKQVEGFKIESLSNNENFISTVFYATTLAIRNHQKEKIEAMQNSVLNTALNIAVEEDLQHVFLNFIDELTPSHLSVLKYFDDPEDWLKQKVIPIPNYSYGGAITIFYVAFPELAKNQDFAKQLVSDLSARGLSRNWESMHVMDIRSSMYGPKITSLGKQFLAFITSPLK